MLTQQSRKNYVNVLYESWGEQWFTMIVKFFIFLNDKTNLKEMERPSSKTNLKENNGRVWDN